MDHPLARGRQITVAVDIGRRRRRDLEHRGNLLQGTIEPLDIDGAEPILEHIGRDQHIAHGNDHALLLDIIVEQPVIGLERSHGDVKIGGHGVEAVNARK